MNKFTRDFWNEKVNWKESGDVTEDQEKVVRHNGEHYVIATEGFSNNMYLGHGGRKVRITFHSGPHAGKVIDTNNLWSQGSIEPEFLPLLEDNAEVDWMYHSRWMTNQREMDELTNLSN